MNLPAEFFPLPPRVEWLAPRKGIFRAPFAFISPTQGRVEIPTGFDTDYASVPRGLWNLYPPDGEYSPAAWVHDFKYWEQDVPRPQADLLFLEGMKALGVGWLTRWVLYCAVRAGGGKAWEENRRARLAEAMDPTSPTHIKQHFHKLRR